MSTTVKWSSSLEISGSAASSFVRSSQPEAVTTIAVSIAANTTDVEVDLQPSDEDDAVTLLSITSDTYEKLTFKVNAAAADAVTLDGPMVLGTAGAVALLDPKPKKLFFSNAAAAGEAAAKVAVTVGWTALVP